MDSSQDSKVPVLMAWSGGKDSTLALAELRASREWKVAGLLTTVTEEYDRISMHGVRRRLLERQAEALGLPLRIVLIPPASSNTTYEERMAAELARVREEGIREVAFGDLYLEDVRAYREQLLGSVGMGAVFPLWGRPTADLARRFINEGYRAVLSCVDTQQIDAAFAGRYYDPALLSELPDSADPCGENGEFHSFVHDGPGFAFPISFLRGEQVMREDRFNYCDLL